MSKQRLIGGSYVIIGHIVDYEVMETYTVPALGINAA